MPMRIENDMFAALDIAASGLKASGKNVDVVASNIANAKTTDAGDGKPYRKLEAIYSATEEDGISGVEISDILADRSGFDRVYLPGHPKADADGYVSMPKVDFPIELINLNLASRAYQMNAAVLKRYQTMVNSSLELLK